MYIRAGFSKNQAMDDTERNTVYGLFREQAEARSDATAVFDERRSLTFSELDRLADTIASGFPVKRPDFVGIVMDHSVEMIASMLAVVKLGAAYIPVEPTFPVERIRLMMRESHIDFIITEKEHASLLPGFPLHFVERGTATGADLPSLPASASPEDAAYVLYTSGTTGMPKGVVVENRNVCHYVRAFWHEFHPGPGDVMLQYSVCTFDIFVEEVFTTLLSGATLAIPDAYRKNNLRALVRFVEEHNVTEISGFPYLLLELNRLERIPSSLRLLISGGDVLRARYISNLMDKVVIYNTYGPSETTVCASYFRCTDSKPLADGTYPIGKPVIGAEMEILDENLRPVPDGEIGEICIFGDGVSRGYLGPTPESVNFTTMPDGRRVYRSGDMGYRLPDGNFAFLRRRDTQVMIMGKRVECDEVENALCHCTKIEQAAVCPRTDTQGLSYLTAYIVPRDDDFSIEELKLRLADYLTPYMIPEFFVIMRSLPLTPNGKIDRKALPVILKEGRL